MDKPEEGKGADWVTEQRQAMGDRVWGSQRARKAWWGQKNSEEGIMRLEGLGGCIMASQVQGESGGHERLRRSWRDEG